jgi:hypothetical protein
MDLRHSLRPFFPSFPLFLLRQPTLGAAQSVRQVNAMFGPIHGHFMSTSQTAPYAALGSTHYGFHRLCVNSTDGFQGG